MDKQNRTQPFFVYKYFINDTTSTRECLIPNPFGGCLCTCGGPYDGLQAWVDNLNAKLPIAQAALQEVNASFEEYQRSGNLKRGDPSSLLPIADPGANRTVEGNTAGGGDVALDGSRSFDPDDRPLTNYTWTGDFTGGKATGVAPTIHLTLGAHLIQLIVGNGMNYSLPSSLSVTVVHTIHPTVHITNPKEGMALQDGVAFTIVTQDVVSPIKSVTLSIRDVNGSSLGYAGLPATFDSSSRNWIAPFNTRLLPDDHYTAVATATDETGLVMTNVVSYTIRNWAQIELLPASQMNQAGRTIPLKFSLRVNATVDPIQPFVYNEQLTIHVYAISTFTLLQESRFGTGARDYRISTGDELYITNFKTSKQPMQYRVVLLRGTLQIGSFTFTTT